MPRRRPKQVTTLGGADPTTAEIINGIGMIIGGIIDTLTTLASVPNASSVLASYSAILNNIDATYAFFDMITQPWILEGGTVPNTQKGLFWCTGVFPIASSVYAITGTKSSASEMAQWYSKKGWYYGNCVYGIAYAVLSVVYVAEWPDDYTVLDAISNIVGGSIPFVIDPFRQNEDWVPEIAFVKFLCEELAAIMTFLNYFDPPGSTALLERDLS